MVDAALFDMFRSEVLLHLDVLVGGVEQIATRDLDDSTVEKLARAAHSIKGAARIIDVSSGVRIAEALEQYFDLVRGGKLVMQRPDAATLQRGLDLVRTLAGRDLTELDSWMQQSAPVVDKIVTAIAALRQVRPAPAATPVRATAPVAPGTSWTDDSLADLFRVEVESNCAALTAGLLVLERDPAAGVASLMRAAHSIKGAARIVDVDLAVGLAHAMEDCFVAAQDGRIVLRSEDIDALLRTVDVILTITRESDFETWQQTHAAPTASLVRELAAISAARQQTVAPARPTRAAHTNPTPAAAARVVRVTVDNINRLMNLAGESLVEARRLEPFASSLHKLGQRQTQLADLIGEIGFHLQGTADDRVQALVTAARQRALECRDTTMEKMSEIDAYAQRAEDLTERLYRAAIASRMRPFADALHGFPRMVRDLARKLDKQVELEIVGELVGVDRDILERLEAPLNHLLRNSIDHGFEPPAERVAAGKAATGKLRLEARHWAGMLTVTVSDDGRGIDLARLRARIVRRGLLDAAVAEGLGENEVLDYLFVSGFSTSDEVTEVSGRGVGLDVVRSVVEEVGGSVRLSSKLGEGTTFQLQLPITLSVVRGVLVEISGEPYAFPMIRIERIVTVLRSEIRTLESRQYFLLGERSVGLVSGCEILGLPASDALPELVPVVVLSDRAHLVGVAVDRFLGEHDLVIRALDPRLGKVADISAAAIMADGSPVLVIDVEDMVRSIVRLLQQGQLSGIGRPAETTARLRILVVDDSIIVREVQRQLLANRGYEVAVAVDGMDGWHALRDSSFDLVITDVDMPRMNGLELVRSIKQDPGMRNTPVMIVSYRDRDEDRARGLEAGANYYFTKSDFHETALLQAVAELIGHPA